MKSLFKYNKMFYMEIYKEIKFFIRDKIFNVNFTLFVFIFFILH